MVYLLIFLLVVLFALFAAWLFSRAGESTGPTPVSTPDSGPITAYFTAMEHTKAYYYLNCKDRQGVMTSKNEAVILPYCHAITYDPAGSFMAVILSKREVKFIRFDLQGKTVKSTVFPRENKSKLLKERFDPDDYLPTVIRPYYELTEKELSGREVHINSLPAMPGFFLVQIDYQYGVIDSEGNLILEILHDSLHGDERGFFLATGKGSGDKTILSKYDLNGDQLVVTEEYTSFGRMAGSPYFTVNKPVQKKEGKWQRLTGLLDQDLKVIVPPMYHEIHPFHGYYKISTLNGNSYAVGIMSAEGKVLYPPLAEKLLFKHTAGFILQKDGEIILVGEHGKLIRKPGYSAMQRVELPEGKTGYKVSVHATGKVVDQYDPESAAKGNWGLVSEELEEVIPISYRNLEMTPQKKYVKVLIGLLSFEEAVSPDDECDDFKLIRNGLWGLVDFSNRTIIPAGYDWIEPVDRDELFVVNKGGEMYCFMEYFSEPAAYVIRGGKWGVVNAANERIVPLEYDVYEVNAEKIILKKADGTTVELPKTIG